MRKNTKTLIIIIVINLLLLSGCSLIVQPKLVANKELKNIPTFDPNDYNINFDYETIKSEKGTIGYNLEVDDASSVKIPKSTTTVIKTGIFNDKAISKCKINDRSYPVLFDTGNRYAAHVIASHIRENKLPIYPLQLTGPKGRRWNFGIAMIENLQIGDIHIKNLPAEYTFYHTGYLPLGIPIIELGQDKEINIPLSVMKKFKYISFNRMKNRIELSTEKTFSSDKSWKSYPLLTSEKDFIYIKSTIEGVGGKFMIDTGSDADLLLIKEYFDKVTNSKPSIKKSWKLNKTGFAPLAGGKFSYESRLINHLKFDGHEYWLPNIVAVVKDGNIHELLEKNKLDGIIGFPFFEKTIVTLDFERGKVWVKKTRRSRFRN